ncbi:MAG TPA: glutaredoxin family protein [Casimicrobiaceae bacterium]|nr:glutaredoxin family protein [Casimicrobiaceae bacterium]
MTEVGGAELTLLSRAYCHLCEEMEAALRPFVARHGVGLTVIDVDAYPALEARYGERVPVLIAGAPESGVELCYYVLDTDAVDRALAP